MESRKTGPAGDTRGFVDGMESPEAFALDRGVVDKNVPVPVISGDETEALVFAEPLNGSRLGHDEMLLCRRIFEGVP
jgi:hypothetical protein